MILQDKPARLPRLGLRAVLALGALLLPLLPAPGHGQQPKPAPKPAPEKPAAERARDAVKAAEIDKARADVKLLQAQLEVERGRVLEIEGRLKQAQERLAKLEGPPPVIVHLATRTVIRGELYGPDDRPVLLRNFKVTLPEGERKPLSPEQRLTELETKLKAVLKEIEEVRKELGQKKGGAKPQ